MKIEENVSLADYTTLKVGGVARYFVRLTDVADVSLVVEFARDKKLPLLVLGGGSNILVSDGVIDRVVVKNELKGITFTKSHDGSVLVTAAAGEAWDAFVEKTVAQELSGLENLLGVPGTVGASPVQNINCYGVSVADVIESAMVFDAKSGETRKLCNEECLFGYRDSIFKHAAGARLVVVAVTFRLVPAVVANLSYRSSSQSIERYLREKGVAKPTVADVREAILHVRGNIGMLEGQFRSAGSFFKNTIVNAVDFARIEKVVHDRFNEIGERFTPWHWVLPSGEVKVATGFLLECTPYNKSTYGEKRWRDVVGLSPRHSLSIVTEAGATAADVHDFANLIIASVYETFGVTIESEVNFVT